jgi:hypothetical protein
MKYLNLSILILVLVFGFEYFLKELTLLGVSPETILMVDSALVVSSGVFMIAFIASIKKMKNEQKYILYLVILTVVSLKALALMRMFF